MSGVIKTLVKWRLRLSLGRPPRFLILPLSLILSVLLILPVGCNSPESVAFKVEVSDGVFESVDYADQVIYLDFWATWCGPCRESFPWMNDMHAKYGAQGLKVVAVSLDTNRALAMQFANELESKFIIGFDDTGTLSNSFEVVGFPTSVVIGRGGKVLDVHKGFTSSKKQIYEESIRKALDAD